MSETGLSAAIAKAIQLASPRAKVERINCGQWRVKGGYLYGASAGTPDRVVLLPGGRTVWLEVKEPSARPRKDQQEQEAFRQWAAENDHEVYVVKSVPDALRALGLWRTV